MMSIPIRVLALILLAASVPRPAAAQCGVSISGRFGGETSAVAQVNASTLMVARGTEVEMFSLANPSSPAPYSPRRKMPLDSPAVKISMTQGSSKAFVLQQNGHVKVMTVVGSTFVQTGLPSTIYTFNAVDVVADGARVYIAMSDDGVPDHPYSRIRSYDAGSGSAVLTWETEPLAIAYAYDRLAIVNGILWAGFHERDSVIFGVEGFNLSNPASPTRTGAALTSGPLSQYTARISAMTAVGTKLLVSYRHGSSNNEDWLRAAEVGVPSNPVWHPAFDLNGVAGTMSSVGNQLRISIKDSGIGTWDTTNPGSLWWLGAYFGTFPQIGQMVSVPSTDYWAAGRAGLMTMNTTNPATPSLRSLPFVPLPTSPMVVRQRGNLTVVLDSTLNALRLFDFTLPEAQQHRGSVTLPNNATLLELGEGLGGIWLACVTTSGNAAGDVLAVYDITNPGPPVHRHTVTGFRTHLLSVSASRLYAFTTTSEFRIYEMTQSPPLLRSITPLEGQYQSYTCMASWSNNAAAIGTTPYGLRLMNTTNATAPFIASTWNPTPGYRVHALAKGPLYLYTSATVAPSGTVIDSRLEVLSVATISAPVQRTAATSTSGFGYTGRISALTYVSNASGKFLVGTYGDRHIPTIYNADTQYNSLAIFELATLFLAEVLPTPIASQVVPLGHGNVAVSGDGSRVMAAGDAAGLYQLAMPTSWAPGFGGRPFDKTACAGGGTNFIVVASGNPTNVTYQWLRDGVPLTDGPTPWGTVISGSTTSFLEFSNLHDEDAWGPGFTSRLYTCVASNSCGSTTSAWARLKICYANCDCSSVAPVLNVQDFACFLNKFAAGEPYANCDGSTAAPVLNVQDFACFLNKFAAGCPG